MNVQKMENLEDIFIDLEIDINVGVTGDFINLRREKFGVNEIEPKKQPGFLKLFLNQIKNPLNAILILAGVLTYFLGEHLDMFVIFAAVLVNICITIFQESRTNKTFQKLSKSKVFDVLVRRDSKKEVVQARELVVGDIVFLNPGDKIPADIRVVEQNELAIDEASFTGEAENVEKKDGELAFSGTIIKRGSAIGIVTAVGEQSEFGQILSELNSIEKKPSAIAEKMKRVTILIGAVAGLAIVLVIVGGVYSGLSIYTLIVLGISVAVSAIPEGLGASVSAALTVGMRRLLKKGILVKDLVSAETMASIDTILTDKTGTLTKGEMSMKDLFLNESIGLSEENFLLYTFLSSDASYDYKHEQFVGDEMDIAIANRLEQSGLFDNENLYEEFREQYEVLKMLPFSSEKKFFAKFIQRREDKKMFVFAKGAPEIILEHATNLSEEEKEHYRDLLHREQGSESRFLGFGFKEVADVSDISIFDLNLEDLQFSGFASFLDPLKDSVGEVLDTVKKMDLNLIMVTGDSKEVAMAVAEKSGLVVDGNITCLEGKDIQNLSKDELYEKMKEVKIFARVSPKDKLKLAQTFIERGHRIAMTGDGVNDVLAISQADIGITFANASEAARESASLVLEKNDFSLILTAVDEARNIIKNIRKTVIYLLSSSFSEVLVIFGALIVGGPMPFLAVHILWANIVEEGLINFAFVFGKNKKDETQGKIDSKILTKKIKEMMALLGIFDGVFLFIFYLIIWNLGYTEIKIQSLMFLALSLNFLFIAYALTDLEKPIFKTNIFANRYLNMSIFVGLTLIGVAVFWEPVRSLLHLEPFTAIEIIYLVLFAILDLIVVEILKYFLFEKRKKKMSKKLAT